MQKEWSLIVKIANEVVSKYSQEYKNRLKLELYEIDKQGSNDYWLQLIKERKIFDHNKNGLVFPFLLKLTNIDPIENNIKHNISYQPDYPDIDTDFLPQAREHIKKYASNKYGEDKVCSVGNWNTFKTKLAILDACRILGGDLYKTNILTKTLLDVEYEEMTADEIAKINDDFKNYKNENPEIINLAFKLRGRIKSQGQHAGGLIISKTVLSDVVPMSIINNKRVSQWTEGMADMQLSKFGLIKFDILGLNTLAYNVYTEELIYQTKKIKIDWDNPNPNCDDPIAGYEIHPDGSRTAISFNDEKALKLANNLKTDAVFQFDTPIAKRVLENGVYSFHDLVAYTALARPGPMEQIPFYVERRDDPKQKWKLKEDPRITELLKNTFGIIIYQEQLTAFWTKFGGLTIPEAEKARKSVAKKKKEDVLKLGPKIVAGFVKHGFENHPVPLNEQGIYDGAKPHSAQGWWNKQASFASYAFNMSHAYSYGLIAYRALWLKAHYPTEFWASILTYCKLDRIPKFTGIARNEGVKFKSITTGHMSDKLTIDKDMNVYFSLKMIKGIGESFSKIVRNTKGSCDDFDDFITKYGKNKGPIERLIKLGAFDNLYPNKKKHLWLWYLFKYSSKNPDTDRIRLIFKEWYMNKHWPEEKLEKERKRLINDYRKEFPKKKIPKKLYKWEPYIGYKYSKPSFDEFMRFCDELFSTKEYPNQDTFFYNDWNIKDILEFEKSYIGLYITSPLSRYLYNPKFTFNNVKEDKLKCNYVDGVIERISRNKTKNNIDYISLVLNDGVETQPVRIWSNSIQTIDQGILKQGYAVRLSTEWNQKYQSFNLSRASSIRLLREKDADKK